MIPKAGKYYIFVWNVLSAGTDYRVASHLNYIWRLSAKSLSLQKLQSVLANPLPPFLGVRGLSNALKLCQHFLTIYRFASNAQCFITFFYIFARDHFLICNLISIIGFLHLVPEANPLSCPESLALLYRGGPLMAIIRL